MSEPDSISPAEEQLLIDYVLGQLSQDQARAVEKRLAEEPALTRRAQTVRHALAAIELDRAIEPPEDLVAKTLDRIASVRRTNALLAMQELDSRAGRSPTFRVREVLAIAASVLVLASVMIPSLRLAGQRGDRSLCAAQMGQIGSALQSFAANHEGKLPAAENQGEHWLGEGETPAADNSRALFNLLADGYVRNPVVFQCPAVGGSSFAYRKGMEGFPQREHIQYSYQHSLRGGLDTRAGAMARSAEQMAILADESPLVRNGQIVIAAVLPNSANHGRRGQNVLYVSGHVDWAVTVTVGMEGDDIYRPAGDGSIRGNEQPAGVGDSFLLPNRPR
jgi:anti-sigma factor RsiW